MTPRTALFLICCLVYCMALLLVYNSFYAPGTDSAAGGETATTSVAHLI